MGDDPNARLFFSSAGPLDAKEEPRRRDMKVNRPLVQRQDSDGKYEKMADLDPEALARGDPVLFGDCSCHWLRMQLEGRAAGRQIDGSSYVV